MGYADEIVDVRPGYANNYLIPQGYAISATASAKKVLAETLKQRAHKEAKLVADAEALAAKLAETALTIAAKAEEGRIFGSVTFVGFGSFFNRLHFNLHKSSAFARLDVLCFGDCPRFPFVFDNPANSD